MRLAKQETTGSSSLEPKTPWFLKTQQIICFKSIKTSVLLKVETTSTMLKHLFCSMADEECKREIVYWSVTPNLKWLIRRHIKTQRSLTPR